MKKNSLFTVIIPLVLPIVLASLFVIFQTYSYWGIGVLVLNLVFLFFNHHRSPKHFVWLSLILSFMPSVRANPVLLFFNVLFLFLTNSLIVSYPHQSPLALPNFLASVIANIISSPLEFLKYLLSLHQKLRYFAFIRLLLSLALLVPTVLIFGILFALADPIFESLVSQISLPRISSFVIDNTFWWFFSLFFFVSLLSAKIVKFTTPTLIKRFSFEINFVSFGLIILFLIFSLIQARYFFLDPSSIPSVTGLSYSDFTRRGYSQMLIAAFLSLPFLFLLRYFRSRLTAILLSQIIFIIFCATYRNFIYLGIHGLTLVRLWGLVASIWLVGLSLLLPRHLLRAYSFTLVLLILTNLVNFDHLISLYPPNLGYATDYAYLFSLSPDGRLGWSTALSHYQSVSFDTPEDCRQVYWRFYGSSASRFFARQSDFCLNYPCLSANFDQVLRSQYQSLNSRLEACYHQFLRFP